MQGIKRRSVAVIPVPEMRDRLERVRAALAAAERAPDSKPARSLIAVLAQEVRSLERDVA